MKILIAADGSEYTRAAARHVARHVADYAEPPQIHLLHVHPPLPYPQAERVIGKATVLEYQREDSAAALAVAEEELERANVPYRATWRVGDVATTIGTYVREQGIDLLVLGSQGRGALAGLVLGSVSTRCLAALDVPILVIRLPRTPPVEKTQASY
jgi:nucleotide-binding universal stress UspA family protein